MEPRFEGGVWVCPICGEKFMSKRVAQMHIDQKHSREAHSHPPENGQTLHENPGVNEKNTHKNEGGKSNKEKGEKGKKGKEKGKKWKKYKIGSTWIKVLDRDEVEIREHSGWRYWQTANYTATIHKKRAKIKLTTGEVFIGRIKTKDPFFIKMTTDDGRKILIHKGSISFIELLEGDE